MRIDVDVFKCEFVVDVFKCIISQLNELAEKLPPEISKYDTFKALAAKANDYINTYESDTSSSVPPLHTVNPEENSSSEVVRKKYHKIDENEDVNEANKPTENFDEPDKPTEDIDEDNTSTEYIVEADKPKEDLEENKPIEDVDEAGEARQNDENVGVALEVNSEPSSNNTIEAASQ